MKDMILSGPAEQRMSSQEIADLVESRHDSVKRTIERMVESKVIVQPPTVDEQSVDKKGRQRATQVYLLDKRSSLIVVAQLSPEFTARVVDRWQELEASVANLPQNNFKIPSTLPEALRLAADLAEKNGQLVEKITTDRPKVEFATAIEDSKKSIKVGDFAKLLNNAGIKVGRNRLFDWLRDKNYLMPNNEPYQKHIDSGWFSVIEKTRETDNGPVPYIQSMITGKGQIALTRKIVEHFNPIITVGQEARA